MAEPQTYKNHVRIDAGFHYVLAALLLLAVFYSVLLVFQHHDTVSFTLLTIVLALTIVAIKARSYAIKVQTRVIRLEERIRLMTVLPALLHHRIAELGEPQLVALRFAGDKELMALTARTLEEKLDAKQIKAAIADWRPDTFRV